MPRTYKYSSGLSHIELLVAFAILAILAKIAMPAFQNIDQIAKDATVKAALGEMRAAIMAYSTAEIAAGRASRFATGGTAAGWPTVEQVDDIKYDSTSLPKVMPRGDVPENPYARSVFSSEFDRVLLYNCPPDCFVTDPPTPAGWLYNENTGRIWANTNVNGEMNF